MSGSPKKKKGKRSTVAKLPKNIRDELRLTVALRGYSKIKCGTGMKKKSKKLKCHVSIMAFPQIILARLSYLLTLAIHMLACMKKKLYLQQRRVIVRPPPRSLY